MASPVPASVPKDADEIVGPAVDGTLRVLGAASGSVRRVVMTSSADAVVHGADHGDRLHTEADWSDPALCAPYRRARPWPNALRGISRRPTASNSWW